MVSRAENILPLGKLYCHKLGYTRFRGTTVDGDALNMMINDVKPSVIMMESSFYRMATPYKVGELLKYMPYLPIAIFNLGECSEDQEVNFIKFGAKSYVSLRDGAAEFRRGVKSILQGRPYISARVRKRMESLKDETLYKADKSAREKEVLFLLADGATTQEIADTLKISFHTIENHKTGLFARYRVKNTVQMIRMALYLGILNIKEYINR
jgi:DNA-binding NarL/FixJ family response regulator